MGGGDHNSRKLQEDTFTLPQQSAEWLIAPSDLEMRIKYGNFGMGDVYFGILRPECEKVIIRHYLKQSMNDKTLLQLRAESVVLKYVARYSFCKLLSFIRYLEHDNVAKFYGLCLSPPNICMVSEFMDRGPLPFVSIYCQICTRRLHH